MANYCELCGAAGTVFTVKRLGLKSVCKPCGKAVVAQHPETKEERAKRLRNRNARERYAAMKSLGLTKTAYGWE